VGGAKTVYQYADHFAEQGHHVVVAHPRESILNERPAPDRQLRASSAESVASALAFDPHPWYESRAGVQNIVLPDLSERWLGGPYDVVVVNNQRTVAWALTYSARMGQRIYFMQDYESYVFGDEEYRVQARRALEIDWPILCTSPVVERLVHSANRTCRLLPKAIDTRLFCPFVAVDSPLRRSIGFPARSEQTKRTLDAIQALAIVRREFPAQTEFWCFGYERPPSLPDWIAHHQSPSGSRLTELYNYSKIFIVSSEYEGYGMPGAEAMACGAALVSTRNGGVETYAAHEYSALLCPVRDPAALAQAVLRLLHDETLRQHIAQNGASEAGKNTIARCAAAFEEAILDLVSPS
jgi:glycosyltransferase involved in cell wall biosynthesis